jgi:hypothetical protein
MFFQNYDLRQWMPTNRIIALKRTSCNFKRNSARSNFATLSIINYYYNFKYKYIYYMYCLEENMFDIDNELEKYTKWNLKVFYNF